MRRSNKRKDIGTSISLQTSGDVRNLKAFILLNHCYGYLFLLTTTLNHWVIWENKLKKFTIKCWFCKGNQKRKFSSYSVRFHAYIDMWSPTESYIGSCIIWLYNYYPNPKPDSSKGQTVTYTKTSDINWNTFMTGTHVILMFSVASKFVSI